jgi:hypothetical protein
MSHDTSNHVRAGTRRQTRRISAAERQLLDLCLHYWEPAYAYLSHHCDSDKEAQALTAAFFRSLQTCARTSALARADGRFRPFLLSELQRFLAEAASACPNPGSGTRPPAKAK